MGFDPVQGFLFAKPMTAEKSALTSLRHCPAAKSHNDTRRLCPPITRIVFSWDQGSHTGRMLMLLSQVPTLPQPAHILTCKTDRCRIGGCPFVFAGRP